MRGWPLLFVLCASPAAAQEVAEPPADAPEAEEAEADASQSDWNVSAFEKSDTKRVAGSAHRISEKELERFEDDNVHRTLTRVPGVYVREEDGYGLRPNIGLRGGASDRSKKITLMEDGVLLAPAPYSAPAAYYFPLMTRMTSLEVFKGPSGLRHGPHTIGGAVNMTTRPIPWGHRFGADLALGSELYAKGHGYYGYGTDHWGALVEAARIRSDGFKELEDPRGRSTGFDRMDFMVKGRINTDPSRKLYNEASIKLGYGREVSHETYLGLTDADFRDNPLRRYPASALDEMRWNRYQVELSHAFAYDDVVRLYTTLYRHDFHREWFKLNRFDGGAPRLEDILADPTGARAVYYEILRGADSGVFDPALLIGENDRTFVSQGIQTTAAVKLPRLWRIDQELQLGARFHYDSIDRFHTEDSFVMRGGTPVSDGGATRVVLDNFGESFAFATYAIDQIELWRFLITPGVRFEYVVTGYEDSAGITVDANQHAVLPGVGLLFQLIEELSFLGGVHMGYSPAPPQDPGPNAEVRPEVAVNYEAGSRLDTRYIDAEIIGFYSDYSNLTGECTFSQGCDPTQLDDPFNAGEAIIYGLEAVASADIDTPGDLNIPLRVTYTLTQTEFRNAFTSDNPAFADVEVGDEMPYIPMHQLAATAGLDSARWGGLHIGATFVDEMRETAGQGDIAEGQATDAYVVFDAAARLNITEELAIYAKAENLLDSEYIVARRPYGARPGRPRFIYGGVKVLFDRP